MKAMDEGDAPIRGRWTHSFEEDDGDVLTYRPTDTFRRSRPREAAATPLSSRRAANSPNMPPGGTTGRAQRLSVVGRPWVSNRIMLGGTEGAPGQVIEVIELTPDILRLRRCAYVHAPAR